MSSYNQAMSVFQSLSDSGDRILAQNLLVDLLDASGKVRFKSVVGLHNHLVIAYRFALLEKNQKFVLPGSWHLFYGHGCLLVRIKTGGTQMRRNPHLTISAVAGLAWNDEVMKLNRAGDFVPKAGAVPQASRQGDFRALQRIGRTTREIVESDDRWANSCHFDFVSGFDGSGAAGLPVTPGPGAEEPHTR